MNSSHTVASEHSAFVDCFLEHNLGDDMFLLTLARRYPHVRFTVMADASYRPMLAKEPNIDLVTPEQRPSGHGLEDKLRSQLVDAANTRKQVALARKSDALIQIGGSIFSQQIRGGRLGTGFLLHKMVGRSKQLYGASSHTYVMGANFGPYRDEEFRDAYARLFAHSNMDVCFRDDYSYGLFSSLPTVRKASDILFATPIPEVPREKKVLFSIIDLRNTEKYGRLSENAEAYEDWILKATRRFSQSGYSVGYVSFSSPQHDDEAVRRLSRDVLSRYGIEVHELFYTDDPDAVMREIAGSEIVVAGRFHATILGLAAGCKVISMIYSGKTANILTDLKYPEDLIIDLRRERFRTPDAVCDRAVETDACFDVSNQIREAVRHFEATDRLFRR